MQGVPARVATQISLSQSTYSPVVPELALKAAARMEERGTAGQRGFAVGREWLMQCCTAENGTNMAPTWHQV